MRILMVSHYFASHRGGVEIVAEQLFRHWTAAGHEVVWMAGDATPPPIAAGQSRTVSLQVFNFVEKRTGIPFPIPTIGAIRKIRAEVIRADTLILHDCLYLTNIFAFLIARLKRVPTLLVQHTRFSPRKSRLLSSFMKFSNRFIAGRMLSRASQVVFVSEATRRSFARVCFRRPPMTVFNGVDAELYRPLRAGESKTELRKRLGLPQHRAIILFIGRFVEIKGLSVLKNMVASRTDYTWAFAGWGPIDPGSWNAANVQVFSGLRDESLAPLYRASDLLILPSVGEGFPLVIQEALASGLPVVSTSDTLAADPEVNGFVTSVEAKAGDDKQTAEAFLGAVDRVLKMEGHSGIRAEERRALAVRRYSWRRAADRYLEIARDLASPKPGESVPAAISQGTSR